jgi:hypothetical protein
LVIRYWKNLGDPMISAKMEELIPARLVLLAAGLILVSGGTSLLDRHGSFGITPAMASSQGGILGQQAPELMLNSWIDGNGRPIEAVKLKAYRGKGVYLYFFRTGDPDAVGWGSQPFRS